MAGGIVASSGLGTLGIGARNIPLVGQAINVQQGEFAPRHGQVMFGLQGGMQPRNTQPALIGQALQGQTGIVVGEPESSGDTFVHISTEEEVTFRQGILRPTTRLSGVSAATAMGVVTPSVAGELIADEALQALPGHLIPGIDADEILVISSIGSFATREVSRELTGLVANTATGTFITNDKQWELGGAALEFEQGVFDAHSVIAIVDGIDLVAEQHPIQAPGYAELVGVEMGLSTSDLSPTQELLGEGASVEAGALSSGADLVGQELNLVLGDFGGIPKQAALAGQDLAVSAGELIVLGVWGKESSNTGAWTKPSSQTGVWTKDASVEDGWTKEDEV